MRKLKRWLQNKLHGYELPKLIKPQELKLSAQDKLCILAPHADDETIGCGGLLSLYGQQCDVILLTDGTKGGDRSKPEETKRIREEEFKQVMSFYDVNKYEFMNAPDGDLITAYDKFKHLNLDGYDYIFMPHPQDSHKDHVVVQAFFHRLKREKGIKAKAVYYEVWGAMSMPTHYIDISSVYEKKREAIALYASQANIDYASRILGLNHYRGIRHGIAYEEAFTLTD